MFFKLNDKKKLIKFYSKNNLNTGCCKIQIILLTFRINGLKNHFSIHNKDFNSKRGLLKLVFRRRKLLNYLKKKNNNEYNFLINELKLRH